MELLIVLLWFVLPVAAMTVALVTDNDRLRDFVFLYLLVNYSVLAVVCAVLVVV